jgi:hypothetical protein
MEDRVNFQGGVTLNPERSSLILWDVQQKPPVVVKIACDVIRDVVHKPTTSEDDCRLIALQNIEVLTDVAQMLFSQGHFSVGKHSIRVIEMTPANLRPHSGGISSSVLETAQNSWVQPANERSADAPMNDSFPPHWAQWLDQQIWPQVQTMMLNDAYFKLMSRARELTGEFNGPIGRLIENGYVTSQTIAIRRLCDRRTDVISLRRLLEEARSYGSMLDLQLESFCLSSSAVAMFVAL